MKPIAAAILFAALALPAAALPDVPEGKWWKRPRIAEEINLSPEQESRLESIFTRARPGLIDRKAALEKAQGELQDALEDSRTDRRAIAARIDTVESARAELQKARILLVLDMKRVLRPEQWERLVRLQENFRRERRERFGRFLDRRRQRPR
ncbi:MAG TPA: periplasmic heavy metal sensor [Thermoanaerobaculia bacterium]|nr:periplasmic heavy metal sensor [Thermoanaerobaculia bacterium]